MRRRTRTAAAAAAAATQGATGNAESASADDEQRGVDVAGDAPLTATVDATEANAAEASAPASGVAPGGARVTRERALYFATGQRASPSASRPKRSAQDGEQTEAWPGYFSTARDLDDNRLAAQAARQEELQRKEQENARLAEHKVVWVPRKKPRKVVLARDRIIPSLQELTLQCLAKHIELLPTLEYIDAAARAQVATAVVKLRRMKSEGAVWSNWWW